MDNRAMKEEVQNLRGRIDEEATYEVLLQKAEADLRKHIRNEQQLKLIIETNQAKYEEVEKIKIKELEDAELVIKELHNEIDKLHNKIQLRKDENEDLRTELFKVTQELQRLKSSSQSSATHNHKTAESQPPALSHSSATPLFYNRVPLATNPITLTTATSNETTESGGFSVNYTDHAATVIRKSSPLDSPGHHGSDLLAFNDNVKLDNMSATEEAGISDQSVSAFAFGGHHLLQAQYHQHQLLSESSAKKKRTENDAKSNGLLRSVEVDVKTSESAANLNDVFTSAMNGSTSADLINPNSNENRHLNGMSNEALSNSVTFGGHNNLNAFNFSLKQKALQPTTTGTNNYKSDKIYESVRDTRARLTQYTLHTGKRDALNDKERNSRPKSLVPQPLSKHLEDHSKEVNGQVHQHQVSYNLLIHHHTNKSMVDSQRSLDGSKYEKLADSRKALGNNSEILRTHPGHETDRSVDKDMSGTFNKETHRQVSSINLNKDASNSKVNGSLASQAHKRDSRPKTEVLGLMSQPVFQIKKIESIATVHTKGTKSREFSLHAKYEVHTKPNQRIHKDVITTYGLNKEEQRTPIYQSNQTTSRQRPDETPKPQKTSMASVLKTPKLLKGDRTKGYTDAQKPKNISALINTPIPANGIAANTSITNVNHSAVVNRSEVFGRSPVSTVSQALFSDRPSRAGKSPSPSPNTRDR
eukprot:TRINITY_DN10119_c0_g6_i2.p1 TRINITY_DN10119_c0_g6~~TRINITY_DN10119_c0_g6_i2.p1  ORF type:complete len:701 (+),score=77.88 TRINITY_DN10119_c0_g6_i2:687-2789(+)